MQIESKLDWLLRYHRQNIFDNCEAAAERHARALRRLKATATFKAACETRANADNHRSSERLLRMYA